jgi:hypothetical protein
MKLIKFSLTYYVKRQYFFFFFLNCLCSRYGTGAGTVTCQKSEPEPELSPEPKKKLRFRNTAGFAIGLISGSIFRTEKISYLIYTGR